MADVLIIDDEEDVCDFLCATLREIGIEAHFCLTGEQVLKLIEEQSFKIFVIDMKLATAVSGIDLIKAIRKKQPETLIAAMSGYIDTSLKESALRCGADEYLEKPGDLTVEAFSDKIKFLLQKFGGRR